jgi:hypothetical protein
MHNYGNNDVQQDKRPGGKSIRAFVRRDGKWFFVRPMKMKPPHKHPKSQKSSKSGGLKSIGSKASKGGYGYYHDTSPNHYGYGASNYDASRYGASRWGPASHLSHRGQEYHGYNWN